MTDITFDFEKLVNDLCAALNNEWRIVENKIKETYTIEHYTYKVQMFIRFVVSGSNEGQLRISGRLCGDLVNYNPYYNDIFQNGETPFKIHVSPHRSVKALKNAVEARLLPDLYQTMREAQFRASKANEVKLRILGDEELLITACRNLLMRVPQNGDLEYYDRRRGRSVEVSVQDPATVAGNVRVVLSLDADEASVILSKLFDYWAELRHGKGNVKLQNIKFPELPA